MRKILESLAGKKVEGRIDKTPARLDFWQSATGVALICFMVVHTFLVSSILISKELMHKVTIFFEGQYFFSKAYPELVSVIGVIVFLIIALHAWIAVRKFPQNSAQYKAYRAQMAMMKHQDTNMWFTQMITGFFIFFFVVVHLFVVAMYPKTIGPDGSSERIYGGYWIVYGILLLLVETHMMIGFYKLCLKWGWFDGSRPRSVRKILKGVYYVGEAFFLILGILTIIAYYRIGMDLAKGGERFDAGSKTGAMIESPCVETCDIEEK